ncbi:MAG: TatD family hydrolase [Patescibacteria group bacterium]
MYKYFDTHAHLDMRDYDGDREELIQKLQEENIGVITIGVDKKSSFEAVALANKYENVYATIGFHPKDAKEEFNEGDYIELIKNSKVVAVGECGLEFFKLDVNEEGEFERQIALFEKQIDFAIKYDKPLVIHCRDAHEDVLKILKEKKVQGGDKLRGVIHFFSGGIEDAQQYLDLGFYFSFGGVLTFTSSYNEVVKFIPLDRILAETDAPFVAPVPYRGQRNEPFFVKEVVKRISELKDLDLEETKKKLVENTLLLFKI